MEAASTPQSSHSTPLESSSFFYPHVSAKLLHHVPELQLPQSQNFPRRLLLPKLRSTVVQKIRFLHESPVKFFPTRLVLAYWIILGVGVGIPPRIPSLTMHSCKLSSGRNLSMLSSTTDHYFTRLGIDPIHCNFLWAILGIGVPMA